VGQPLTIAACAVLVGLACLGVRRARPGHPQRVMLAAALGWGLYAAWEALVQWRTPDADIRVDLLLIWPVLGLLTLAALVQALRTLRAPANAARP